MNPFQAGYKPGRLTQENLLRLTEGAQNAFKRRHCLIGIFLDIEGAFDRLWQNGLRIRMADDKLPIKLVRLISFYLTERRLVVREGQSTSEEVLMEAGKPQGAILSPDLFNYGNNDAPFSQALVSPAYFADDSASWTTGRLTSEVCRTLQAHLDEVGKYTKKWRISLAPTKTQVILISRCPLTHKPEDVNLTLLGTILRPQEIVTFLGVLIDSGL